MQDLHRIPTLETPRRQVQATLEHVRGAAEDSSDDGGVCLRSRVYCLSGPDAGGRRAGDTPGELPARRRTTRACDMDVLTHYCSVLPGETHDAAPRQHAITSPRAARALPVLKLRPAPRREHEDAPSRC